MEFGANSPINSFATTTTDHVSLMHKLNCTDLKTVLVKPSDESRFYRVHATENWLEEISNKNHTTGDWFGSYKPISIPDAVEKYNLKHLTDIGELFLYEFKFNVPHEHPEFCFFESKEWISLEWQGLLTNRLIGTIEITKISKI